MTSPSGPSEHDLSEADLVVGGERSPAVVARRRRGDSVDPVEAQVADLRPSAHVCRIVPAGPPDERRRATAMPAPASRSGSSRAGTESPRAPLGLPAAASPAGPHWYWAALVGAGAPLLHVAEWDVPPRARSVPRQGAGLWAEHSCDAPMEQWTIANETYAAALDDPDEALGRAYGVPTAVAFDLEWYATAPAPHGRGDGLRAGRCRARRRRARRRTAGAGRGARPSMAPLGRRTRRRRRARRRTPTPGCGRRSPSPTARSPTGCSRPTAGDGFLVVFRRADVALTGGRGRRTRRSTSQTIRPTPRPAAGTASPP